MPFPFWIRNLGGRGEYLALRYYRRKGYFLIGHNIILGHRELDLVMSNGREILILEVKSRRPNREPQRISDLVTKRQRNRILEAGSMLLRKKGWSKVPSRYLVVYFIFKPNMKKYTMQTADLVPGN